MNKLEIEICLFQDHSNEYNVKSEKVSVLQSMLSHLNQIESYKIRLGSTITSMNSNVLEIPGSIETTNERIF